MDIRPVRTGRLRIRSRHRRGVGRYWPTRLLRTLACREWATPVPIFAWLLDHPEGSILVDTGESARSDEAGYFPGWHPFYRLAFDPHVVASDEIGPQLRSSGVEPTAIDRVVLTHLHTDHAGGLRHLPDAEVLVRGREFRRANSLVGRVQGHVPSMLPDGFAPTTYDLIDEPYGPFPRHRPITRNGDVIAVPTPGHTAGHVSIIVERDDHAVFLAGDASYTEGLHLDGTVDGVTFYGRAARRTHDRIRAFARERPTIYLPSHDPAAPERLEAERTLPVDR